MKAAEGFSEGFTLMELVVVIAIIGVMAAVAIPGLLLQVPKFRVNGAVRNLASDMQWAKLKAVAENNDFIMEFDSANNRYLIYDDNNSDTDTSGSWSNTSDDVLVKTVNLSDISSGIIFGGANTGVKRVNTDGGCSDADITGITFTGTRPAVTFQTTGIPNKSGAVYLIPSDDDDAAAANPRVRAITLVTTGRIKAWKLESKMPCSWSQQ